MTVTLHFSIYSKRVMTYTKYRIFLIQFYFGFDVNVTDVLNAILALEQASALLWYQLPF